MYLDQKAVLHIVDPATKLSAVRFSDVSSTTSVWAAVVECLKSVYNGLLNRTHVGRVSCFRIIYAQWRLALGLT